MAEEQGDGLVGPRRRRSVLERLAIVEESYVHGMSVARVARKNGVNANQVFQWRSLHRHGRLMPPSTVEAQLLPVRLIEEPGKAEPAPAAPVGKILIELPGRISIRAKSEKVLRQIEQLELQLEELGAASAIEEKKAAAEADRPIPEKPFRRPLPEHLSREIHTHLPDHTCCPDRRGRLR